jgi:SAM-dependent methyltransferase
VSKSQPEPPLYDTLAPVYDRWQSADGMTPFALVALAKLLPALARHGGDGDGGGGGQSFLDLGCGTGELLLGLGRAHPRWRLVGVDGSAHMLAVARDKPGGERITWIQGQLAAPPPAQPLAPPPFDAAGCFYDTVNHLGDRAALVALFTRVAAGLRPGGLFIFDATNELGFRRWWGGNRAWRGPGWSVAIETHYDPARRLGRAAVVIDHQGHRSLASLEERYFTDGEVRGALATVGLEVVLAEPWSPFDIDAPGKTWWISRKTTV